MKVLILKPSSLGDVIQAVPVLRLIKRHLADAQIYWWIDSNLAPLLEADSDLAGIVRFERQRWASPRNWGELWQRVAWLRAQRFDWVIDLQSLARTGAIAWLANGDLMIGLDEPREGARGFYDVIVRRASFYTHAVDWYLAVLPFLGVPMHWDFEWLPKRAEVAATIRSKWPVEEEHWVVVQPGARWVSKRWPVEYFTELIRRLKTVRSDLRFAILGSSEDIPLGNTLAAAAPDRALNLTGKLSLPEMIEWIRSSQLMVTNDTGPMHIAAAIGVPLVALFGPTEPRRTGPYGQLDNVLQGGWRSGRAPELPCAPCLKARCGYSKPLECLRALQPDEVFEAVQKRLEVPRSKLKLPKRFQVQSSNFLS